MSLDNLLHPHGGVPHKREPFRITGRHVLFGMLGFFGLILAVNLIFVTVALDTFTGLTDRDSYRTGVSWNQKLDQADALRKLGWHVAVEPTIVPVEGKPEARYLDLTVSITDPNGAPIKPVALAGEARHPIVQSFDQPMDVVPLGPGRYRLAGELPTVGDWTIRIVIERAEGTDFRLDRLVRVR